MPTLLERAVAKVAIEEIRRRVGGDVEIGPAIAVIVACDDAEPVARGRLTNPGRLADVRELSVPQVFVEDTVGRWQPHRAAENPLPLVLAGVGPARPHAVALEFQVVDDEEIHEPVSVVVEERSARPPSPPPPLPPQSRWARRYRPLDYATARWRRSGSRRSPGRRHCRLSATATPQPQRSSRNPALSVTSTNFQPPSLRYNASLGAVSAD